MAESRRRGASAPPIAAFRDCMLALQTVETRLSALLAHCAGQGLAHAERLALLPALARFEPFAVSPGTAAGAPPTEGPTPTAATSARRRRPAAAVAESDPLANARAATTNQATAAALAGRNAASGETGAPRIGTALAEATTATGHARENPRTRPSSDVAPQHAGALITALLQRHPAPHHIPRLRGIGGAAGEDREGGASASPRPATGQPTARRAPIDALRSALPAATALPAGASPRPLDAPLRPAAAARQRVADAFADPLPASATSRTPRADDTRPAGLLQSHGTAASTLPPGGSEALRALVEPLFGTSARPPSRLGAAHAADNPTAHPGLIPTQTRQVRAPSRLLAGADATAAERDTTPGHATVPGGPALPATAADTLATRPAELAAGLERLLREQAWLRGVDLT